MKLSRLMALSLVFAMLIVLCGASLATADETDVIDILLNGKTARTFLDDPVAESDLNTILLAGLNAQSAMNSQPWHFSVITGDDMLATFAGGMGGQPRGAAEGGSAVQPPEGPPEGAPTDAGAQPRGGAAKAGMMDAAVAIVISCSDSLRWNSFDAGGACDRMSVAALALGYGTKIVAGPCDTINASDEYKALCGIPDDMNAMAVLLIGKIDDSVDATSSASTRNALEDVVTFVSE